MKALFILTVFFFSLNLSAQEKWDIGIKYERNNYSWLQLEGRYHFNQRFSITAQLSGSHYSRSHFHHYGDFDSVSYYQNNHTNGDLIKFNMGVQYFLPFKKKRFYVGANIGFGHRNQSTFNSYYTGPNPFEQTQEVDPSQSFGFSIINAIPTNNYFYNNKTFINSDLVLGIDVPLREKILLTTSVSGGLQIERDITLFSFSAAIGLRYKLGKTTE